MYTLSKEKAHKQKRSGSGMQINEAFRNAGLAHGGFPVTFTPRTCFNALQWILHVEASTPHKATKTTW